MPKLKKRYLKRGGLPPKPYVFYKLNTKFKPSLEESRKEFTQAKKLFY